MFGVLVLKNSTLSNVTGKDEFLRNLLSEHEFSHSDVEKRDIEGLFSNSEVQFMCSSRETRLKIYIVNINKKEYESILIKLCKYNEEHNYWTMTKESRDYTYLLSDIGVSIEEVKEFIKFSLGKLGLSLNELKLEEVSKKCERYSNDLLQASFKVLSVEDFNSKYGTSITGSMPIDELTDNIDSTDGVNYVYASYGSAEVMVDCKDFEEMAKKECTYVCVNGVYLGVYTC